MRCRDRYGRTVGWTLAAHRAADADLRGAARRARIRLRPHARRLLAADDQGFLTVDVQTPPDASYNRTTAAVEQVEKYLLQRPGVEEITFLHRLQLSRPGRQHRAGVRDAEGLSERGAKESAADIANDANKSLASIRDAKISALQPPPIDNLGNSSGFSFRLQDRGQKGYAALMQATEDATGGGEPQQGAAQNVFVVGLPPSPQIRLARRS